MSTNSFANRHIGIQKADLSKMLSTIGVQSVQELIQQTIPNSILSDKKLSINDALTEQETLAHIKELGQKNEVWKTYIGQGYYPTITPPVILRNILENPGWYTQYTPYQAEIAQGRLEALLNFQTVISDLTGLPIANSSLLDEATAAAEAMSMFYVKSEKKKTKKESHQFKQEQLPLELRLFMVILMIFNQIITFLVPIYKIQISKEK